MIVCTAGLPGRFSEWCEALLGDLLRATGATPAPFAANSLEDIGRALLQQGFSGALIVARQPHSSLGKTLGAVDRPFLVTLDRPEALIAALMRDYQISVTTAVRQVANAMSAMLPLLHAPRALILDAEQAGAPLAIATALAAHFELGLDAEGLQAVAANRPSHQAITLPDALAEWDGSRPPLEKAEALIASALNPLWARMRDGHANDIVWGRDLFFLGDEPAKAPLQWIDVTGRARCLIFGPYIQLPEGPWSCRLTFAGSERTVGIPMSAEIFATTPLGRANFEIEEAGLVEIEFSFVNSMPDTPIEVRLFNAGAVFEGEIALEKVCLTPLKARRLRVT